MTIWQPSTLASPFPALLLRRAAGVVRQGNRPAPRVVDPPPIAPTESPIRDSTFGWLAFGSGFSVLLLELRWGRLAKFVIGNRTLAISVLLFSVLIWLGAASIAHRRLLHLAMQIWPRPASIPLRRSCNCVVGSVGVWCGRDSIAAAMNSLRGQDRVVSRRNGAGVLHSRSVFPWPLAQFPLVNERTGHSVGFLYASNVVGRRGAMITTLCSSWPSERRWLSCAAAAALRDVNRCLAPREP